MQEHNKCLKEYEWGKLNRHLESIDSSLIEIKESLKEHSKKLNRRPVMDKLWSGASGFAGGFTAVVLKFAFWK